MIDNNDIERLKEIFVTRRECENNTNGIAKKLSNDDKRLAVEMAAKIKSMSVLYRGN